MCARADYREGIKALAAEWRRLLSLILGRRPREERRGAARTAHRNA